MIAGTGPESTLELLDRAKNGDHAALGTLLQRYQSRVRDWAHGRLPRYARALSDTDDLVQKTLLKTLRNFDQFSIDKPEGFHHYLRLTLQNALRDEIRRARRKPFAEGIDDNIPGDVKSPLDHTIDQRRLQRYEAALARLSPEEREAVVARLELGFTHQELAAALGKNTPDAARKACQRALSKLLMLMQDESAE